MPVLNVLEKIKKWKNSGVLSDFIFLACFVGIIILLGFYAELLGDLVARLIKTF